MSTPLDEIKRLRAQLAERDRQLADKTRHLAQLQDLVGQHLEATARDDQHALDALKREQAAFERGYDHGDEDGWRRGVEHTLMAVDEAHMQGNPHDHHGRMRELEMHDGHVPPRMTTDEILERCERYDRIQAEWWWNQFRKEHPHGMPVTAQKQGQVRQLAPKGHDTEREAVLMRHVYDPYTDVFSTPDVREIELGRRVVVAEHGEDADIWPYGRTERGKANAQAYITANAARAEATARNREYEKAHPQAQRLDDILHEAIYGKAEIGE